MRMLAEERIRHWLPLAALLAAIVIVGIVSATRADDGLPLSPDSADPDGTRALVAVLEQLGATVGVVDGADLGGADGDGADAGDGAVGGGRAIGDADVVLLAVDNLDEPARERLRAFARSGGTLVVTDPGSPLTPTPVGPASFASVDVPLPRGCDVPALRGAESVLAPGSALYEAPDGATGCYGRRDAHWFVAADEGQGRVVSLGGPAFLTNGNLAREDNGVFAAALLAPVAGTRVAVIRPDFAASDGDEPALIDLVPPRVRAAVLQLALAFLLVVAWRARRLGKPVRETHEVQLAGSELVSAVGQLLQRSGSRARAAAILREDLRLRLAERLGLGPQASEATVADAAAARGEVAAEEIRDLLSDSGDLTDAQLVELAQRVEAVRGAVLAHRTESRGAIRAP